MVRQMLAYAFPQAGQNTADTGDVDRTYSRYYNKKAIKVTKQEFARVRAALAEKYARRHSEGQPLPDVDYVDLGEQGKINTGYTYIVRNYDFGSFEVVGKHSSDSKQSENARRDIDGIRKRTDTETDGTTDDGRVYNSNQIVLTENRREVSEAAGLDRGASESERAGSAVDVAGDLGRDGERGRDAALKTDRNIQADATAVSAGQAGDGSSQPTDATGAARVMLERAFPQAGQQAQVEQTSVQGQAADGQIQGMQPIAAYAQSYDWQTAQEFQDYYQPEISPAEYAAGFAAVYNAARQGLSRQAAYRQTTVLTEKQRRVAFKAGQQANIRRAQRPGAEQMQQYQARLVNGIRQAAQDVSAQVIDPGYKSTERINDKSGSNEVAVSLYIRRIRRRRGFTGNRSP